MKLVRYCNKNREHYGIQIENKVASLPKLAKNLNNRLPETLEEFIASGKRAVEKAEKLIEQSTEDDIKRASSPSDQAIILAPIAAPPKIVCLGINYRDHAAEQNVTLPDEPVIFLKPYTTIIGPNQNVVKPCFVKKLDYEAELAIVIGRKAKNIPVSDAKLHIFGYTILNDISAYFITFIK